MSRISGVFDSRIVWGLLIIAGLLALRPTPVDTHLREAAIAGYQSWQAGQFDQALEAFDQVLQRDPAMSPLHIVSARLALLAGDPERAGYDLDQAELAGIEIPESRCMRAVIAVMNSTDNVDQTLTNLEGLTCDQTVGIISQLAEDQLLGGQWVQAIEMFSLAAQFQPENLRVRHTLAILQAISNPEAAVQPLSEVSQIVAQSDQLLLDLIRAIEDSRPSADPAYSLAQVGQTLARYGLWREAAWAFEHALEVEPNYLEAQAYLGLAIDRSGGDGYDLLQSAERAFPNAGLPHVFLGMHWSQRSVLEKAQLELEIATGLDPNNPSAWAELGSVYAQQGMVAEAREAYIQAVVLAPTEWEFWYLLALFSTNVEIEIDELGLPAARNLVSLDTTDPRAYDLLGYAHYLNGNMQLAERFLLWSAALDPFMASTQYHLGQLRRWQGDYERSRAAFELALQLDPDGSIGELARRALGLPASPSNTPEP